MTNKNDGGPAFPTNGWKAESGTPLGMSLRAWLTGKALCGWAAGRNNNFIENSAHDIVADACVKYADAVIRRLEEE